MRTGMAVFAAAGVAAGWALGPRAELPVVAAQETEVLGGGSRGGGGETRSSRPDIGPVWGVVAAEVNMGVEKGKYLLYNNRTGESYALHNNADRWVALPFVEGEAGAVGDSSRGNLKRFGRQGPSFLPFSAVLEDSRAEGAERQARNKAAPQR